MAIIAHLDMDAFFAAVEERDNPQWAGLPIVVGSDPKEGQGRGVVSTANYAARKYGIRSALPITKAWQFAKAAEAKGEPATIFVQGFWRSYSSASKRIMQIINNFLHPFVHIGSVQRMLQQTGVDETYIDLSFAKSFKDAQKVCEEIKQEIKKRTPNLFHWHRA